MIWTILGISVGVVAVFCVAIAETLVGKPGFESHRAYVAGAVALVGACLWLIGVCLAKRRYNSQGEEGKTFVLADLRYWGPMFLVLAIITLFIQPLRRVKSDRAPKPIAAAAPAPQPKPPVNFPRLKMQGVFFRAARPFAIINGESYTVGDHLGDVTVKAIDRTSVVVELSGEEKLLTLN